jgi:hypothetical protein
VKIFDIDGTSTCTEQISSLTMKDLKKAVDALEKFELSSSEIILMVSEKIEKLKSEGIEEKEIEEHLRGYITGLTYKSSTEKIKLYPWKIWGIKSIKPEPIGGLGVTS